MYRYIYIHLYIQDLGFGDSMLGLYRDNGEENEDYYSRIEYILG